MTQLYPLKFEPIIKSRPWGGNRLSEKYGKTNQGIEKAGESWELCGLEGDESVIMNGFLAGNTITEIIEVYMGDILGEKVYEKYGDEFPLLIKLIDAAETLSVQVHPDDNMAAELHNAYGKTEMWYVLHAEPGAGIYCGFREGVGKAGFLRSVESGELAAILNYEPVEKGDLFYIPAGMVHAIGGGVTLAEIQQSSDITYRIFDWNRVDNEGNGRELHTDLAAEAAKFNLAKGKLEMPVTEWNKTIRMVSNHIFTASLLRFNTFITKNYNLLDSFVVLLCTEGSFTTHWENGSEVTGTGQTILIPASAGEVVLEPESSAEIIEIYMNTTEI